MAAPLNEAILHSQHTELSLQPGKHNAEWVEGKLKETVGWSMRFTAGCEEGRDNANRHTLSDKTAWFRAHFPHLPLSSLYPFHLGGEMINLNVEKAHTLSQVEFIFAVF